MLIVLIGESGCGKGLVSKYLDQLGVEEIFTYTERPPRHELDNHIFVKKEDYENAKDIIAETDFGSYHYWMQLDQIDWHRPQCAALDINGLNQIRSNSKLDNLKIVALYIKTDTDIRFKRVTHDCLQYTVSLREATDMARQRTGRDKGFEYIPDVTVIDNNGTPEQTKELVKRFYDQKVRGEV